MIKDVTLFTGRIFWGSKLKQLSSGIWVFDSGYRGECPKEETDQIAYGLWMRYRFPNAIWWHTPNETGTSARVQFIEKRRKMGVTPGIGDNTIITRGANHRVAMIEAKRRDKTKSRLSQAQRVILESVAAEGHFAAIAYGIDELKKATLFYFGLDE